MASRVRRSCAGCGAAEGPGVEVLDATINGTRCLVCRLCYEGSKNGSEPCKQPNGVGPALRSAQREEAGDAEVEPLPTGAVRGLLDLVGETIDRYVVLPGAHERTALQLFAAHTWALDGAHATPYLLVISPEKRSGKSRLLQVLELLVAKPWGVIGTSEAAMFRKIAKDRPTLLLDEIDAIFGTYSERTEPLRAILNAGNRPGVTVARCVGQNMDVEDFPIFCAKVLAGIDSGHRIPDTIRDRAVTIHMQRKTGAEPVERFRHRDAEAKTEPIREALKRWAVGAADLLLAADPDLSPALDDRAAEAWEPLLAIAEMAGDNWPERAREAALALSAGADRDEATAGTLLLEAIRKAFDEAKADKITTADLLAAVNAEDEFPFGGWREGRGLDSRLLAERLKPYGIRPRSLNLGGEKRPKGYQREQFEEPWERWLLHPDMSATSATSATGGDAATESAALESQSSGVAEVAAISGSAVRQVEIGLAGGREGRSTETSPSAPPPPPLCRHPDHREHDYIGESGQRVCGVCHPRPKVRSA